MAEGRLGDIHGLFTRQGLVLLNLSGLLLVTVKHKRQLPLVLKLAGDLFVEIQ